MDSNVESVVEKHRDRASHGFTKYGVTTERTDIDLRGWLVHLQEELMDASVYVERLLQEKLEDAKAPTPPEKEKPNILAEAWEIVNGARRDTYGHPIDNHQLTADYWWGHIQRSMTRPNWRLGPEDVCLMNVLQKLARFASTGLITRDGLVDTAGYAENIEMIWNERERRKQAYNR